MSPDNGAKEASSGVACSKALTYQCRMPPGSIFHVPHVSVLSVSDKIIPPKKTTLVLRERNFLRETRGGRSLAKLNFDVNWRLRRRSETFPVNRICSELTGQLEDQQQNKQHHNPRDNQNVAPKTQPRPPRPHPKLLLRLHANRPPRRRPHVNTKHPHPLRQRPPTPLLRIRHLFHRPRSLHRRARPPPLLLLLRLTPPPPRAPAAVQTPATNVPHANPRAGAGIPSARRRGARKVGRGAGVLL